MALGGRSRPPVNAARAGLVAFALVAACATEAPAPATVYFQLDAPLCSSVIPVQFSVDGAVVGADTFRVHLPPDHVTSAGFAADAGARRLGARVVGGFVWPDTTVDLAEGQVFTLSLPFYCS